MAYTRFNVAALDFIRTSPISQRELTSPDCGTPSWDSSALHTHAGGLVAIANVVGVLEVLLPGTAACTPAAAPLDPALPQVVDRTLIRDLMDRYGTVHDSGTPEEYADLFTPDGEIAIGGGPVVVKGREACWRRLAGTTIATA